MRLKLKLLKHLSCRWLGIICVSILALSTAYATEDTKKKVYKIIGADGTVTYSDKPSKGAEEVEVPLGSTYTPAARPPYTTPTPRETTKKPKETTYSALTIESPANDATIRDNTGNVSINIVFSPALAKDHQIQFLIDGNLASSGSSTSTTLSNLDRGTHELTVRIVDGAGEVLVSQSSIFHLKRHFVRQQ